MTISYRRHWCKGKAEIYLRMRPLIVTCNGCRCHRRRRACIASATALARRDHSCSMCPSVGAIARAAPCNWSHRQRRACKIAAIRSQDHGKIGGRHGCVLSESSVLGL